MIRIEVKSAEFTKRSGNKNGRDWSMRTQEAWAHTVERNGTPAAYPEKISITLNDGQEPYQVGNYQLEAQSLYVGDYGSLRLGTPILKPLHAKVQQVA